LLWFYCSEFSCNFEASVNNTQPCKSSLFLHVKTSLLVRNKFTTVTHLNICFLFFGIGLILVCCCMLQDMVVGDELRQSSMGLGPSLGN
jgi:hypothetical protein